MFNLLAISYADIINLANSAFGAVMSLISTVAFWLVGHVFMAIALFAMAKNKGIKKGVWIAVIPFVNYYLLGKIIGEAVVWGKKIKNVGLWVMIFSLTTTILNLLINFGGYLVNFALAFNLNVTVTNPFLIGWFSGTSVIYTVVYYVSWVFDIAYLFFDVSVIFLVFRLYRPQSAMLFSLLSIFFNPPLFGILLFVIRNDKRISFKQYFRPTNPYGFSGGGYNPYGNPYAQQPKQPPKPQEDPFPEFSDKDSSSSHSSDDLFS